jgi:hypothetical protein
VQDFRSLWPPGDMTARDWTQAIEVMRSREVFDRERWPRDPRTTTLNEMWAVPLIGTCAWVCCCAGRGREGR